MERLMWDSVCTELKDVSIIHANQYGFTENRSCQINFLILSEITNVVDKITVL